MDGMQGTILVVSPNGGFLAKSLVGRMEANKYCTILSNGEIAEIEKKKKQMELIILFLSEEWKGMVDTLVYLKDMANDRNLKFVLIGDDAEHEFVEKIIPATHVLRWFRRPLVMDELTKCVLDYMSENTGNNRRKTILIVDDDITYMRTVYEWLKEDYHVGMAANGVQAISYLARNKADLVLLDYEMPIANGPQVLQMLKNDTETGQIPVMFLTGHSDRASVMSVVGLHPADYLLKTIDKKGLLLKLEQFFQNKKEEITHS